MQETFKEIEREISTRKIEIKAKPKLSLNAFGNEQESFLSVNSYIRVSDYWSHLCRIINRTKEIIKAEHDLCVDPLSALDLLEEYHLYLCELRKMHLPENKELILDGIDSMRLIPGRYAEDISEIIEKKVLHFWEIQKIAIHGLEDFLERKIKSSGLRIRLYKGKDLTPLTNPLKFKQTEQLELFEQDTSRSPKLFWTRTDTDLIELITALRKVNAIKSENGNLTKKQFLEIFEVLLNHPIKGASVKLSKIKYRKGKPVIFLYELYESMLNENSRTESSD
jgi:hypothetical protein